MVSSWLDTFIDPIITTQTDVLAIMKTRPWLWDKFQLECMGYSYQLVGLKLPKSQFTQPKVENDILYLRLQVCNNKSFTHVRKWLGSKFLQATCQSTRVRPSSWPPFSTWLPGGLVVRIRRSHRRGRGSIPRLGSIFWSQKDECGAMANLNLYMPPSRNDQTSYSRQFQCD